MTFHRAVRLVVGAATTGLVVGVALSGADLVSVPIWIGASATALVAVMIRDLVMAASVEPAAVSPAWNLAAVDKPIDDPREMQNMRVWVSSAERDPRSLDRYLRPHLVALAEHYLPRRHGFDLRREDERVSTLLGDLKWLIDPTVNDRTPTRDELERFLDVVLADETHATTI